MGHVPTTRRATPSASYSTAEQAIRAVLAEVLSCWPHAKVDREDSTGAWRRAVETLSYDQVRTGIQQLSQLDRPHPPAPGEFRSLCIRAYRPEDPPAPERIADHTAKGRAWRVCQAKFAERVVSFPVDIPMPIYDGPFDWQYVVASAPMPESSQIAGHQYVFRRLRQIFEVEWEKFEGDT